MNSEEATIRGVRDVGEWRLVVWLARTGIRVWLAPVAREGGVRRLLSIDWPRADEELLSRIESAVYDHPEVLDDFSADIIVEENHGLWLPVSDSDEFEDADAFASVYGHDADETLRDEPAGENAPVRVYYLANGLRGFLNRTFPGARILSQQTLFYRMLESRKSFGPRAVLVPRQGWCDILAFNGGEFLSGSSQQWSDPMDIVYHLANLCDAYGLDREETEVQVFPLPDDSSIAELLRRFFGFVRIPALPRREGDGGATVAECLLLSPDPDRRSGLRAQWNRNL